MKKLITCIIGIFAFLGLMILPVRADNTQYVIDDYGLLSESEISQLNDLAQQYSRTHDVGIYIRVYDDYYGYVSIESFAESIYIMEDLDDDCILLLITMRDRSFDIFASYGGKCEEAFGQYAREKVADKVVDRLSEGAYYSGFKKYLDVADEYLKYQEKGTPVTATNDPEKKAARRGMASAITFSIPELIALVACFGMKGKMKTTGIKTEARRYIAKNGILLTNSDDIFLYRSETRTPIQRDHGGGGGSSFSSSSGSFGSHTSGHF